MKYSTIRIIALINCVVAIIALVVSDIVDNHSVSTICKVVLAVAWLIQGVYIVSKRKNNN